MDKTPKQLTNYPKRQEKGKKSRNTYMRKLEEEIQITDNQLSTSSSTITLHLLPFLPQITLHLLPLFLQITLPHDLYMYMSMELVQL